MAGREKRWHERNVHHQRTHEWPVSHKGVVFGSVHLNRKGKFEALNIEGVVVGQ
jgi:hypothetical protein